MNKIKILFIPVLNGMPLNKDTAIKFNKTGKIVEINTALPVGSDKI